MEKETIYWEKTDDGRVKCTLCPRYCTLKNGQRGLCFVRGNENDQVVLHTYGRSSGFCIDPIEKNLSIIFILALQFFHLEPPVVICLALTAKIGTFPRPETWTKFKTKQVQRP